VVILRNLDQNMSISEFFSLDLLEKLFMISLFLLFQKTSSRKQGLELGNSSKNPSFLNIFLGSFLILKLSHEFPQIYPETRIFNRELLQILSSDSNKELRKAVISNIQLTNEVIHDFLKRIRDSDEEIVEFIYKKLIDGKVLIANLDIADIYNLLYAGIYNRSRNVKKACLEYFKRNFEYFEENSAAKDPNIRKLQILDFLKLFHLKESLKCPRVYKLLEDFFEGFIEDSMVFSKEKEVFCWEFLRNIKKNKKICSEEAFLLKVLMKFGKKSRNIELMEAIEDSLPCLFELLPWMKTFIEKKSLLGVYETLQMIEFQINFEEKGKEAFIELIREISLDLGILKAAPNEKPIINEEITDFFEISEKSLEIQQFLLNPIDPLIITCLNDLIEYLLRILRQLLANNDLFIISVMEMISDLKGNFDNETEDYVKSLEKQLRNNEVLLEKIKHDIAKRPAINELKALKIEEIRILKKTNDIEKERLYVDALITDSRIRSLKLLIALLRITPINLKHPGNSNLLSSFIAPNIMNPNNQIKQLALFALSLYVSLDQSICYEYFQIFLQIFDENAIIVSFLAMRSLCDFILLYEIEEKTQKNALDILRKALFHENVIFQKIAIESIAKILFSRELKEILSLSLLTNLVFIWLECDCEKSLEIYQSQFLSMFFRNFTFKSIKNLELFEKVFEILVKSFLIFYKEHVRIEARFSKFQLQNTNFLNSFLKVGLYLFKTMEKKEGSQEKLTVQEKFFIFLCRHFIFAGNDIQILEVFEKSLNHFEFEKTFSSKIKSFFLKDFLNRLLFISPDLKKKKGLFILRDKFAEKIGDFKPSEKEFLLIKSLENSSEDPIIEIAVNNFLQDLKDLKILHFSGRLNLSKYHLKHLS